MKLSFGLSPSEVRAAREKLDRYIVELPAKVDEFCRRLAEIGVDAAVMQLSESIEGETGELIDSIHVEQEGEREWLVVTYCDYAVYVEFGTGIAGTAIPYPGERPEGIGSPNATPPHARVQFDDGSWVYYDPRQGRYRITSGQQPVGFMAMASVEMALQVMDIAKEVFNSD